MSSPLADLTISSKSKQYVAVPVSESLSAADPTSDSVSMAFPAPGGEPLTFYTGSWITSSGVYYARCLIGTGGAVALTPGLYDIFVKITDSTEVPVLNAGILEVT